MRAGKNKKKDPAKKLGLREIYEPRTGVPTYDTLAHHPQNYIDLIKRAQLIRERFFGILKKNKGLLRKKSVVSIKKRLALIGTSGRKYDIRPHLLYKFMRLSFDEALPYEISRLKFEKGFEENKLVEQARENLKKFGIPKTVVKK